MTTRIMIVTGGSRGLGAAIAVLAAHRGFDVCISYRTDGDGANATAKRIRETGRRALAVSADVGDDGDVRRLFDQVDGDLGPPSALVNNAGVSGRKGRVDALDFHCAIRSTTDFSKFAPIMGAS